MFVRSDRTGVRKLVWVLHNGGELFLQLVVALVDAVVADRGEAGICV